MRRYVGIDLHKNQFVVCYLSKDKEEYKEYRVSKTGVQAFKSELRKSDGVVIESTGNTGYLAREIQGLVKEIKIINPMQFKVISKSVKKTDERDAKVMAEYYMKGLILEVRLKTKEQQQLSSLINTRHRLVKLRTALKNKVHNILNVNGIVSRKEE